MVIVPPHHAVMCKQRCQHGHAVLTLCLDSPRHTWKGVESCSFFIVALHSAARTLLLPPQPLLSVVSTSRRQAMQR